MTTSYSSATVIAFVSQLGAGMVGIIGLAIATRLLTVEEFSQFQVLLSFAAVIALGVSFGTPNVLVRLVALHPREERRRPSWVAPYRASLVFVGVGAALFIGLGFPLIDRLGLTQRFSLAPHTATAALLIGSITALSFISDAALRGAQRFFFQQALSVLTRLALVIGVLASNLLAVELAYVAWLAIVQIPVAGYLFSPASGERLCTQEFRSSIKEIAQKGPLFLLSGIPVLARRDLLVLWIATTAAVDAANFRLASQVFVIFLTAAGVLEVAYLPKATKMMTQKPRLLEFHYSICRLYILLLVPPIVILLAFHRALFSAFFGDSFADAGLPAAVLSLSILLLALFGSLNNTLIAAGLATEKLIVEVGVLAVLVSSVFLMSGELGPLQASIAILIANCSWYALAILLLARRGHIDIPLYRLRTKAILIGVVAVITALICGSLWITSPPPLVITMVLGVTLALWVALVYWREGRMVVG